MPWHKSMRLLLNLFFFFPAALVAFEFSQPTPGAPPLQKFGKGKYAHWPIATHITASHKITVSLAIDRSPDDNRIKIKYFDALADSETSSRTDHASTAAELGIAESLYRQKLEHGRLARKLGFILLENRDDSSRLLGMQISEAYRGQGHAKVLIAIWAALCLIAGVSPCTGKMNKPILAHVLTALGFCAPDNAGRAVRLTDAKRLRDCTPARRKDTGASIVRVMAEFQATDEIELGQRVAEVLAADSGQLEISASREQILAALDGTWMQDGELRI